MGQTQNIPAPAKAAKASKAAKAAKAAKAPKMTAEQKLEAAIDFGAIAGNASRNVLNAAREAVAVYGGVYTDARRGFIIGMVSVVSASMDANGIAVPYGVTRATLIVDGVRPSAAKVPDGRHLQTEDEARALATANRAWSRAVNDLGIVKTETRGAKAGGTRTNKAEKAEPTVTPTFTSADTLVSGYAKAARAAMALVDKNRALLTKEKTSDLNAEFLALTAQHAAELGKYLAKREASRKRG